MRSVQRPPAMMPRGQGGDMDKTDGQTGKGESLHLSGDPPIYNSPWLLELPILDFLPPRKTGNLDFYGKHPHFHSWQGIQGFLCLFFKHGAA